MNSFIEFLLFLLWGHYLILCILCVTDSWSNNLCFKLQFSYRLKGKSHIYVVEAESTIIILFFYCCVLMFKQLVHIATVQHQKTSIISACQSVWDWFVPIFPECWIDKCCFHYQLFDGIFFPINCSEYQNILKWLCSSSQSPTRQLSCLMPRDCLYIS